MKAKILRKNYYTTGLLLVLLIHIGVIQTQGANEITKDTTATSAIGNDQEAEINASGTVTDQSGESLIGVNVIVKGTDRGTTTDIDGQFSLSGIDENAILVFSYIGYQTTEIAVNGRTHITVQMIEESEVLEELVVVGYGTQKKVNLTGAVDQFGPEVLENRPVNHITQALQGVVPNLNITLADGKPIRSAAYQVRGASSIGQGGSALVLIDGVEGDPSLLNPADIESISVLKDAASAAIYGARGTFGVILITTKSPQSDKISVNYNVNYGIKSPTAVPDFVTDGYTFAKWFSKLPHRCRRGGSQKPLSGPRPIFPCIFLF